MLVYYIPVTYIMAVANDMKHKYIFIFLMLSI